jgi:hypothetical protein
LAVEIGTLEAELIRFEQFFALIDQGGRGSETALDHTNNDVGSARQR